MELKGQPPSSRLADRAGGDLVHLKARAQAYEETVSLALFTSAWLQHACRDPQASRGARLVARLLASCSSQPVMSGPDSFAAARRFLEEERD